MAHLAAPLAFPLGGGTFVQTACDVWAQDLIEVRFSENLKNDVLIQAHEAYMITPEDGGQDTEVTGVQCEDTPAIDRVWLIVTPFQIGKTYVISFQNLFAVSGLVVTPQITKFVGRRTKIDSLVSSRPGMYDVTPGAMMRKLLNAVGRSDDLIGGSRKDRIVDFDAVSLVLVDVQPPAANVPRNNTLQLTATVTGTTVTDVIWDVNGVVGGYATNGTISPTGLYTAPALIPAGNPVTVTATSVVDPVRSDQCIITVT